MLITWKCSSDVEIKTMGAKMIFITMSSIISNVVLLFYIFTPQFMRVILNYIEPIFYSHPHCQNISLSKLTIFSTKKYLYPQMLLYVSVQHNLSMFMVVRENLKESFVGIRMRAYYGLNGK